MKRHNNLFEDICNKDNLRLAHKKARRGKTKYREVKLIDKDLDLYIDKLHDTLISGTFNTSKYTIFTKQCGRKVRTIYSLPYFPDRIVQHAIMQVVEPILVKTFIRDTFQSLKGRGSSDCRKRVEKAIKICNDDTYVLNFDIKQFYPSVDNDLLKLMIRSKIKCSKTLILLDNIIDSTRGLPIGNYTSQILGNFYLNRFDHYAKEVLKIKNYFRYCDDIVVLATREGAHIYKDKLFDALKSLKLTVKDSWQIFPLAKRPLDYVGFVFGRNTKLRRSTKVNFKNKVRYLKRNCRKVSGAHAHSSLMSYRGHFKYTNARGLWNKYIDPEIRAKLKEKYGKSIFNAPT